MSTPYNTLDKESFLLLIFLKLFKTDPQSYFYFDNSQLIKKIFKSQSLDETFSFHLYLYFPNAYSQIQDLVKYYISNGYSFSSNLSKEFYKVYYLIYFMNVIYKNIYHINFETVLECYYSSTREEFLKFIYDADQSFNFQSVKSNIISKTYEGFKNDYHQATGEIYDGFS